METILTLGFFIRNYFDVARNFNVSGEVGTKILFVSLRQEKGSKTITFDKICWFGHYLISEARYTIDTLMEDSVVLRFFIWAVPGGSSKAAILISQCYKKKDVLRSNDLEVKLESANKHNFTIWDHSLLPSFPRLHVVGELWFSRKS